LPDKYIGKMNQMSLNYSYIRRTTMKFVLVGIAVLLVGAHASVPAQKNKSINSLPAGPLLTRTISRHEVRRFGYGGTITVAGAPRGSITIEGWAKNEVDITAEIELQAATEEDLARLAAVNGFALDDDVNHLSLLTTGMHDKSYMKKAAKGFPKQLLGLPWKIDYRLRVPVATELEINGGVGPIILSGVEGAIRLSAPQTDATLTLTGGIVTATIASGTVKVRIASRSWRGSGVDIKLGAGEVNVELPVGFSGDIDADILRIGKIENSYPELESRERPGLGEKIVRGRAGAGGAFLKFTVGDGLIRIMKSPQD
jgi:hypothetical protein